MKTLQLMHNVLTKEVHVYVITFGPTLRSMVSLTRFTSQGSQVLLTCKNRNHDTVVNCTQVFVNALLGQQIPFHGFCLWSHGAGFGIGPWRSGVVPFLAIDKLIHLLIRPFPTIRLVCFDACYQGSMSSMFELPASVYFVLASPAMHPYSSILQTRAFGKLKDYSTNRKEWGRYAHEINCEWHDLSRHPFKCLLVFDNSLLPPIAKLVRELGNDLVFDRYSQIDKDDTNLHDLFVAARLIPELRDAIKASIHLTCKKCLAGCTRRVQGPSVEARLPRKWRSAYLDCKWYKEVVNKLERFIR